VRWNAALALLSGDGIFARMQAPQRFWSTTWLVVALSLTNAACNLSGLSKLIYDPEQAALEEDAKKKRAEVAQTEDGSCRTAEQCKYRCEILERALDCYKTGKAALKGRDVHYAGGWRVDRVSGSTDDVKLRYEQDSEGEDLTMIPLARESFNKACAANHAESCRYSGIMVEKHSAKEAAAFYRKGCALKDEACCKKLEGDE